MYTCVRGGVLFAQSLDKATVKGGQLDVLFKMYFGYNIYLYMYILCQQLDIIYMLGFHNCRQTIHQEVQGERRYM